MKSAKLITRVSRLEAIVRERAHRRPPAPRLDPEEARLNRQWAEYFLEYHFWKQACERARAEGLPLPPCDLPAIDEQMAAYFPKFQARMERELQASAGQQKQTSRTYA